MVLVVRHEGIVRHQPHRSAGVAVGQSEGSESHSGRTRRRQGHGPSLKLAIFELEQHLGLLGPIAPEPREPSRRHDAISAAETLPSQVDRRHRPVERDGVRQRNGGHHRVDGKADSLLSRPPGSLEVADEHELSGGKIGLLQDGLRELEPRSIHGALGTDHRRIERTVESVAVC